MRLIPVVLVACLLGACGADDSKDGSGGAVAEAVDEVFEELVVTISAEPDATVATARAELRD